VAAEQVAPSSSDDGQASESEPLGHLFRFGRLHDFCIDSLIPQVQGGCVVSPGGHE
jgi:hypothetical protein